MLILRPNMSNKFFLIFIVFVLGISQNTEAMNFVALEQSKTTTLSVSESIEGAYYENGKNSKHPNFTGRITENNVISSQFRGLSLDYCHNIQSSTFIFLHTYSYNLFISIEIDINNSQLPLFKLFNNYRI